MWDAPRVLGMLFGNLHLIPRILVAEAAHGPKLVEMECFMGKCAEHGEWRLDKDMFLVGNVRS